MDYAKESLRLHGEWKGNIGPEAGMPVMEGKCALFKAFGDVDAFPLCIKSNDGLDCKYDLSDLRIFWRSQSGGYFRTEMFRNRKEAQRKM